MVGPILKVRFEATYISSLNVTSAKVQKSASKQAEKRLLQSASIFCFERKWPSA